MSDTLSSEETPTTPSEEQVGSDALFWPVVEALNREGEDGMSLVLGALGWTRDPREGFWIPPYNRNIMFHEPEALRIAGSAGSLEDMGDFFRRFHSQNS